MEDAAAVVHVAGVVRARSPGEFDAGNAFATANLIHALLERNGGGRVRFVHVSSLAAVGPSNDGKETDRPPLRCTPVSRYGVSKRNAEIEVAASGERMTWICLRPPIVYGPHDRDLLLLFRAAARGRVFLSGKDRIYSFLHVGDLCEAILRALKVQASGFVPVTRDPPLWSPEVVALLGSAVGRKVSLVRLPFFAARAAGACAELWSRIRGRPSTFSRDKVVEMAQEGWVADPEPARRAFGFCAERDAAEGFAETAEWYRCAGWLSGPVTSR